MSETLLFDRARHVIRWIAIRHISIRWSEAQRPFVSRKAERIAANFDQDAFCVVIVTEADTAGMHHCIEGQHRVGAVRILAGEDEEVPCVVIPTQDPARAAQIWTGINVERTKADAMHRFRVAVTAGSALETEVAQAIDALGWVISTSYTPGHLRCVDTLLKIWRRHGPQVFRDTLGLLEELWGKEPAGADGNLIEGLALIAAGDTISRNRPEAISRIQKAYTAERLIGAARAARATQGRDMSFHVARLIGEKLRSMPKARATEAAA